MLLAFVLVAGTGWFFWRWYGQTVDVVIVNASGLPGQFSWQPQVFADEVTVDVGGCESKSIQLLAGERWQFDHDRIQARSAAVDVPLFGKEVAVEIWLGADGSSRLIAAHPIDGPMNAPYPPGCATQDGATP
ncbi:MAG TPA: hypothetical protein VGM49_03000 [Candidatus Limnocylindrales bacterium]